MYANLVGMPVFIISDREVAEELLNERGKISAGRPRNGLLMDLCVAFPHANTSLINNVQNGFGRVEFGVASSRKVTLRGALAYAKSHNSRCHRVVSPVD